MMSPAIPILEFYEHQCHGMQTRQQRCSGGLREIN